MTLAPVEFLRRFLLHRLPRGFHHIRQYGFLGNRRRTTALRQIRALLPAPAQAAAPVPAAELPPRDACPQCGLGRLVLIATLAPSRLAPLHGAPAPWDTS